MDRKIALTLLGIICLTCFVGCNAMMPYGIIFNSVSAPDPASTLAMRTGNLEQTGQADKSGKASAIGILWIFAAGDHSIQAAMKDGGLTKIHHFDSKSTSILGGLFARQTTIAYGE